MNTFNNLVGSVCSDVQNINNYEIIFTLTSGEKYKLYHDQECCESVMVEDIIGDLSDLVGSPILMAEEVMSRQHPPDFDSKRVDESYTWTFYKFATINGYATIRWLGTSNGYYSEQVSFQKIT